MKNETVTVGAIDEVEVKKASPLSAFDLSSAMDTNGVPVETDDEGKFTGIPVNWIEKTHINLKKVDFNSRSTYILWQAQKVTQRILALSAKRDELVALAAEVKTGVTPVAKKMKRAARLAKQLEALKAQLIEEEGIDPSEFDEI